MKKYLAYSGGIASTTLLFLLQEHGEDFEAVNVNHGADYPRTYEYIKYINDNYYPITEVKPNYKGYDNLYKYCFDTKYLFNRNVRWCKSRFKTEPYEKYLIRPCINYVGISYDERNRINYNKDKKNITSKYPLIELKMTKQDCINYLKERNIEMPSQSCCFICFNMSNDEIKRIYYTDPELWKKIEELDNEYQKIGKYLFHEPLIKKLLKNSRQPRKRRIT